MDNIFWHLSVLKGKVKTGKSFGSLSVSNDNIIYIKFVWALQTLGDVQFVYEWYYVNKR